MLAGVAWAQEAGGGTGAFLPNEWLQFFPNVELPVMAAIGIVAFVLQRSNIGKGWSLLIPLGLGTIYGIAGAIDAGTSTMSYIFKGALMNGAGASVCAHGVDLALQKWWPVPPKELTAVAKGISDAANLQQAVEAGAVPTVQVQANPAPQPKP